MEELGIPHEVIDRNRNEAVRQARLLRSKLEIPKEVIERNRDEALRRATELVLRARQRRAVVGPTESECLELSKSLATLYLKRLVAFEVLEHESEGFLIAVLSQEGEFDLSPHLPVGWYVTAWWESEGARGHRCAIYRK
ncbi:MAG TPA: hypothetical protein VEK08_10715 [Planctomycetota bacterium]|nr:hypothetical protein [Planctomycetota bacterium]